MLPLLGATVQSLVKKLSSHKLHGMAKKIFLTEKKNYIYKGCKELDMT